MRIFRCVRACTLLSLALAVGLSIEGLAQASRIALQAVKGIEGIWEGKLEIPTGSLRVIFNVKKNADGTLASTADSPDQGAKGIPIARTTFADGVLKIDATVLNASFEGKLSEDGSKIVGTFKQGASLPLILTRVAKAPEVVIRRRPQTPTRPYPYREREVSYENRLGGVKLAGTLTLPNRGGPNPVVLLITGSGAQDRNETLLGHQPFLVLSDYLTRRGIAVLRVDDRGVGGSTGSVYKSTTQDFAGDVLAGVAFLKQQKEIDPKRIGHCGHSEGGVIAPMVAARSKDVAFIIMMAGTGVTGDEIIYRQAGLIARAGGAPEALLKQIEDGQRKAFAIVEQEKDPAVAEKRLRALRDKAIARLPEEQRKSSAGQDTVFKAQVDAYLAPWFRYFLTLDPRIALRQVHCPVLVLNGEKDMQVDPKQNVPEVEKALKEAGNRDVTVRISPSLNHLFQTSTTGSPSEYEKIEETISPSALKLIGDWIEQHAKTVTTAPR